MTAGRANVKPSKPLFEIGQRVRIDVLKATGKVSAVHGFDPYVEANVYEVTLDSSGKEVQWTEGHLSKIEDVRA